VHDNAELFDAPHDRMLVLTDRGSHCTYYEVRGAVIPALDLLCTHVR
jgi:hypothetical protein